MVFVFTYLNLSYFPANKNNEDLQHFTREIRQKMYTLQITYILCPFISEFFIFSLIMPSSSLKPRTLGDFDNDKRDPLSPPKKCLCIFYGSQCFCSSFLVEYLRHYKNTARAKYPIFFSSFEQILLLFIDFFPQLTFAIIFYYFLLLLSPITLKGSKKLRRAYASVFCYAFFAFPMFVSCFFFSLYIFARRN